MISKDAVNVLVVVALLCARPLAALAGGSAYMGMGARSNVSTGVSVSSRRGGSTASIFIRVGNRWVQTPWNYYVAAPVYRGQSLPEEGQPNGTDANGVLHINGYRAAPSGWLRVQVEPRDAEVLVNGLAIKADTGSAMSNSVGLLVGRHHVEVRKVGYQTFQTELPIQQAKEVLLEVKLEK